jgi:hypothetical protein
MTIDSITDIASAPRSAREAAGATDALRASADRLERWVREHDYKAYDPGDGQRSFLRHLTFGSLTLERLLTAFVLRVPFNVRPWLGITPHTSTKGMGFMAWGYLTHYRVSRRAEDAEKAVQCLEWLIANRSPRFADCCWGNDFTFTTRAGRIPRGEPTIVWSGLIGQAFMDAHELLRLDRYREVAVSTSEWVLKLPREETANGACLSYTGLQQLSIHNSNLLGGALLARVGAATGKVQALDVARQSMRYSCGRQNMDGSWFYGEADKYHWIDSFHTGYNLDSLKRYATATGDHSFDSHLRKGLDYFKRSFFAQDGCPRYMHDRDLPVDIQCAAQGIDTLAFLSGSDRDCLPIARQVAQWTIRNMQAPDGHFYYRDLGWTKIRTPMLHWGQGTMFKALAHLECKLGKA